MVKAGAALLGSNISLAILKFLRNVLIARLLSVEEFGVASTFAIIFSLIEMLGYLGLDRLLVQARDGEAPRVQAALQSIQLMRSFGVAVVLYLTAAPLANVMSVPEVTWGFQLMAIIPLVQGFVHFDTARAERSHKFGPFIKITLGAELFGLLTIYPIFVVFDDYRIALYSIILQQLMRVFLSHLLAERPYRIGMDKAIFVRAFRFGWPLIINTVLLFCIFQGDRIIVANQLGATMLGYFSLAFMLSLMATNILAQTQQRLFLPKLSALQDDEARFGHFAKIVLQSSLVIGLLVTLGFAFFGSDLVLLVFGEKYDRALGLLVWLAIMQAVRIAKSGASVVAMARGETMNMMLANVPRILSLPLAWVALEHGAGLTVVVALGTLGEALGLVAALILLQRWLGIPLAGHLRALALWAAMLSLFALDAWLAPPAAEPFASYHGGQLVLLIGFCAATYLMGDLRRWIQGHAFGSTRLNKM